MNSFVLSLYSLFLFAVVLSGNSDKLIEAVKEDAGDFVPWLIAVFVIVVLYEFQTTRKIVAPFAALLVLNFFLKRWPTVSAQFSQIYNMAVK